MNSYHIDFIHAKAAACSAYLQQTNVGGIKIDKRHDCIHALGALSHAHRNEQALNANLWAHLNAERGYNAAHMATIHSLQAALANAGGEANRVAVELLAAQQKAVDEAAAVRRTLDAEREDLERKFKEDMLKAQQDFEERLKAAEEEMEQLRGSKKNTTKTLSMALSFAKDQQDGAVGWLLRTHGIADVTFPQKISALEEAVRLNPDLDLDADVMTMINGLEAIRLGNDDIPHAIHDIPPPTTGPVITGGSYDVDPPGL